MCQPPMNLVIAINRKYVRYAYVMLTSFLLHNTNPLHVYVLHRELTAADEEVMRQLSKDYSVTFHFIYVPDSLLPPEEVLATSSWGVEAYFRLAITDLMPTSVGRALYLDTDMIVHSSVEELYFCELAGNKIAACKEFTCSPPFGNYRDTLFAPLFADGFYYFNSGTLLYDLDALRPSYSFAAYMETAKALNYAIQFPDQDLLNYCHHKETLFVDTFRYNLNARYAFTDYSIHYEEMKRDATIIHYASSKPWRGNFVHCNVEQIWWEYAAQTPFYEELLWEMLYDSLTDTSVNSYLVNLVGQNEALYTKLEQYQALLEQAGIQI